MNYTYLDDLFASKIYEENNGDTFPSNEIVVKFQHSFVDDGCGDLWMTKQLLEAWHGLFTHFDLLTGASSARVFRYSAWKYGAELIKMCKEGFLEIVTNKINWDRSLGLVKCVAQSIEKEPILGASCLNFLTRVYFGSPTNGKDVRSACYEEWYNRNATMLERNSALHEFLENSGKVYIGDEFEQIEAPLVSFKDKGPGTPVTYHIRRPRLSKSLLDNVAALADGVVNATVCHEIESRVMLKLQAGWLKLPTGSTADCGKRKAAIYQRLRAAYGSRFTGNAADGFGWIGNGSFDEVKYAIDNANRYARLGDVPKSGEKRRLIGPNTVVWAVFEKLIQQTFYDVESFIDTRAFEYEFVYVNLNDQTFNRGLAQMGSATGLYATVDFTAASDSQSEAIFRYIMPESIRRLFCWDNPTIVHFPVPYDENEPMECASVGISGSALTFPKETHFLGILAEFVAQTYRSLIPEDEWERLTAPYYTKVDGKMICLLVSIYGDDVVIADFLYEFFCEISQVFGLEPNMTKSYATSSGTSFREACGGWYYEGINYTPIHFPRKPILGTPKDGPQVGDFSTVDEFGAQEDSLATLIKAVNRLSGWPMAQQPLLHLLRKSRYAERCTYGCASTDGIHISYEVDIQQQFSKTPYLIHREVTCFDLLKNVVKGPTWGDALGFVEYRQSIDIDPYTCGKTEKVEGRTAMVLSVPDWPSWMDPRDKARCSKVCRDVCKSWLDPLARPLYHEQVHRGLDAIHPEWKHKAGESEVYDLYLLREYLKDGPSYPDKVMQAMHCSMPRTIYDPIVPDRDAKSKKDVTIKGNAHSGDRRKDSSAEDLKKSPEGKEPSKKVEAPKGAPSSEGKPNTSSKEKTSKKQTPGKQDKPASHDETGGKSSKPSKKA